MKQQPQHINLVYETTTKQQNNKRPKPENSKTHG